MIGVVILNYLTWEKTVACVHSILKTYTQKKQIVIIDNGSTNNSFEQLSSMFAEQDYPDIHIVKSETNGGFSKGNNIGFYFLRKNYPEITEIIITNNDIIFLKDALFILEASLNAKKNAAVIAPHVLSTSYESTNRPWVKKPTMFQSSGLLSTNRKLMAWEDIHGLQKVYMVSGCCLAVNANEFEKIGAFDENVFLYNEENILSYKIRANDLDIYVNSDAKIIHDHGATTGNSNIFVDKEMLKSSLYFFHYYENKNKGVLALFCFYWTSKMIMKTIMKKYKNSKGLFSATKEIWNELLKV